MEPKLKPCPFCGKLPLLTYRDQFDDSWGVECSNRDCEVSCGTYSSDKEIAIKTWNTRKGGKK